MNSNPSIQKSFTAIYQKVIFDYIAKVGGQQ